MNQHVPVPAHLCFVETSSEIETEWPFLQEQLLAEPTLWYDYCDIEELEHLLWVGLIHLWVVKSGEERLFWFMSEIRNGYHEDNLVLNVWWMRGERMLENLPLVVDRVSAIMREKGFKAITISGRKGWERALAPGGFKHLRTELILHL